MRDLAKGVILIAFTVFAYLTQSGVIPFLSVSETQTLTKVLLPTADAECKSDFPTQNWGIGWTYLNVYYAWTPNAYSYAWLKFDISEIPAGSAISYAELFLYANWLATGGNWGPVPVDVRIGADTWTEGVITWSTMPSKSGPVATQTISTAGAVTWDVTSSVKNEFAGDKTITFVLTCWSYPRWVQFHSRDSGEPLKPLLTIKYALPTYALTVNLRDENNNPLDGTVSIMKDTTEVASGSSTGGTFTSTLQYGTYKVKAFYQTQTQETTITLDSAKTVTLAFTVAVTPPERPATLTLNIKDQLGNPLQALVLLDTTSKTADTRGTVTHTVTVPTTVSVKASIQVGERTFESSQTILLDQNKTETITITRRFLMRFFFNYTDGTLANGTLYISNRESLNVPISNGVGEAYLLDGRYKLIFVASPGVDLGIITVIGDSDIYATMNKETAQVSGPVTSSTPSTSPVTTPSPPFLLIPGIYIYILIGVLVVLGLVAIAVRARKPK